MIPRRDSGVFQSRFSKMKQNHFLGHINCDVPFCNETVSILDTLLVQYVRELSQVGYSPYRFLGGSLRVTPPLCDLFGQEFQTTHLLLSVNALQGLAQNFDKYLGLPFPMLVHSTARLGSKYLIEL